MIKLSVNASFVRNIKELFEEDYFDRQNNKDKECFIILIAQKLISRTKYREINDISFFQIKIK